MAPFKPPPNFKFFLLFSKSMFVIPNPCQFNAEIKCPSFDVNPTPALFVSPTTLKAKLCWSLKAHPCMNQPL